MKRIIPILVLVITLMACAKTKSTVKTQKYDPFPVKYENELFSISLPKGWETDDSGWKGLDSMQNEVDFRCPNNNLVWFHMVKTFFPIDWKDVDGATEMAMQSREWSGDENVTLINRVDSVEVGGYPSNILVFENIVGEDTLIQKQYVTYMKDSHIVMYFNEVFYINNWKNAQELGDDIINTIRLKKVKNPLDDEEKVQKAFKNGSSDGRIHQ